MIKTVLNVMLIIIMLLQAISASVMMLETSKIMGRIVFVRLASMRMLVSVILARWAVLLVPVPPNALIVTLINLREKVKVYVSVPSVNISMALTNVSNAPKPLTFARNVMLVLHA